MTGFIYYIACTETGRLKIGFTRGDVFKRMAALQTGAPTKLSVIAVHPGTLEQEKALHAEFRESRVHGEWFTMTEALFERICMTTWLAAAQALHLDSEPPHWVLLGLASMNEHIPLPPHLASLIGEGGTVQ